jgi:hypothetical protein
LLSNSNCTATSRIGVEALKAVKGKHSKKTLAFVKATTAFCQITIPSIAGVTARLHLLLTAAEAALLNGGAVHVESSVPMA